MANKSMSLSLQYHRLFYFFEQNIEQSAMVKGITAILQTCPKIDAFTKITQVYNLDLHRKELVNFKSNLMQFQKAGEDVIYTANSISNSETF